MGRTLPLTDCVVDLDERTASATDGVVATLTDTEVRLLAYLADRSGEVVPREELLVEVWGYHPSVVTRAVDSAVKRLRRKIELDPANPRHLRSIYGEGYQLEVLAPRAESFDDVIVALRDATSFVGRRRELERLGALVEGGTRLVTIKGTGGAGKTRLSREFAASRRATRRVLFVDLSNARSAEDVARAVAAALDLRPRADEALDLLVRRVGDALGQERTLLIADNLEQVVQATPTTLGRWLAEHDELQILGTSRERLHLPGEVLVELGPLSPEEGARLFVDRAAAARADLELHHEDPVIKRIVTRLDALPLSLELAAARVALLDPTHLAHTLDAHPAALAGSLRGAPERHATLAGAIAWSWDLLDPVERSALAQLSVFRGAPTVAWADRVIEVERPTLDVLLALRDKSLVRPDPERPDRLRAYEAVRDFAAGKLDELGLRDAAEARHRALFLDMELDFITDTSAWSWASMRGLGEIQEEMEAIWDRCRHRHPTDAVRAALVLDALLSLAGTADRRSQLLEWALQHVDTLDTELAVELWIRAGVVFGRQGAAERGLKLLERAASRAQELHDPSLAALAELVLARFLAHREPERATRVLASARARAADAGDDVRVSDCDLIAGHIAEGAGDLEGALAHFQSSASAARRARSRETEATARYNVAFLALQTQRHETAEAELQAAMEVFESVGDERVELMRSFGALVHLDRGDLEAAESAARAAMQYGDRNRLPPVQAEDRYVLGFVLHLSGRLEEAQQAYAEAVALYRTSGRRREAGAALALCALLDVECGRTERARIRLRDALEDLGDLSDPETRTLVGAAQAAIEAPPGTTPTLPAVVADRLENSVTARIVARALARIG